MDVLDLICCGIGCWLALHELSPEDDGEPSPYPSLQLYAQGIFPSQSRVSFMLPDPNWMIMPETRAAWHAARHELGLE